MNRIFLHMSEVGTVCDEINVHVVRVLNPATTIYDHKIGVEEFLKNPSTETAPKHGAVWNKDGVRLYITDQTRSQVGGWVDGVIVRMARRSSREDRIKGRVRGDSGISLFNPKPKTKKGGRSFVVLVG